MTQGAYLAKTQRQSYYIHFDNASSHTAKSTIQYCESKNHRILPHPPYSPDLAPSDFFLFGYIKGKCKGKRFNSTNELIEFINDVFYEIPKPVIISVFDEWVKRLEKCIECKGEYF